MRENSFQVISDSFEKKSPTEKLKDILAYQEALRDIKQQDSEILKEAYKEAVRKYAS